MNWDNVISWFNNIEDKPQKCFINFHIKDFYPSIKKDHLINAIKFDKKFTKFTNEEIEVLIHICQTIVCYHNTIGNKLNKYIDIAMGSFHGGAEVYNIVGLFIQTKISPIVGPSNIRLYRDNRLGIITQSYERTLEKLKNNWIWYHH